MFRHTGILVSRKFMLDGVLKKIFWIQHFYAKAYSGEYIFFWQWLLWYRWFQMTKTLIYSYFKSFSILHANWVHMIFNIKKAKFLKFVQFSPRLYHFCTFMQTECSWFLTLKKPNFLKFVKFSPRLYHFCTLYLFLSFIKFSWVFFFNRIRIRNFLSLNHFKVCTVLSGAEKLIYPHLNLPKRFRTMTSL